MKSIAVIILAGALSTIATTAFCQKSDRALDESKPGWIIIHGLIAYAIAGVSLYFAVNVQGLVK